MIKKFLAALVLIPAVAMAQFECKPSVLPSGEGVSGDVLVRITTIGAFAAWRCKPSGNLQMAVVRHDYITPGLLSEFNDFRRDPSFARMNIMAKAHKTGDFRTDPKLVEVWKPWEAQINNLK